MSRDKLTVLLGTLLAWMTAMPASAQVKLRFSAFGDFIAGYTSGEYANPEAQSMFEAFGDDTDPLNTNRGFGLTGTDFVVISDMTDGLTFLSELNVETSRGGSGDLDLDVERMFVDYRLHPKLNLQAGLFFTPIGYNNRFLYARAWLMNSIQFPDFYEEELNLVPTHTVGVAAYGEFSLKNGHRIQYIGSVGNGRQVHAGEGAVYARDPSRSKEVTGLVEWLIPGFKESRLGISGWAGRIVSARIDTVGQTVDIETADSLEMSERGLDVFAVINTRRFGLNAEYVKCRQEDRQGVLANPTYTVDGGMAEVSLNFLDGKLHPYVRYDVTSVPDGGGPYLSLREDGDELTRVYVPEFEAVMTGAAYDVNAHLRLKVEVIRHLDGPRKRNGLAFQSAFGF